MNNNRQTIMVVEDEQLLRDVYKLVLETNGYDVQTAKNGQEALNKLQTDQPDVILLDIMMPVMDGKQFMRTVDLESMPGTKVIVYSNLSDSVTKNEMLGLGASRFVLKSDMTPGDLINLIKTV